MRSTLKEKLAMDGGLPIRDTMLPYGKQYIDEDDIAAVVAILRSDWLTTGPKVAEFEAAFADFVGAKLAVAVSNGTAALHAAMYALDIGPGDEVIVPIFRGCVQSDPSLPKMKTGFARPKKVNDGGGGGS